jgi:hypothetical protein
MLSEQYSIFLDNVAELCSAVPLKFRQTRRGDIMLVLHHNFNSCALALLSIKKGTCQICRKDSAVKMLHYHIAHSHRRHTGYVEFILTSQACRWSLGVPGCYFGRSDNPISTKGGRLCPPNNTGTPGFSDLLTALQFITCSHVNFPTSNLVGP